MKDLMTDNNNIKDVKKQKIQELFALYATDYEALLTHRAAIEAIEARHRSLVEQLFEVAGDDGATYMHPTLGSVILVRRVRPNGETSHFLRHVRPKAVIIE
jgi:hypothetical protein